MYMSQDDKQEIMDNIRLAVPVPKRSIPGNQSSRNIERLPWQETPHTHPFPTRVSM